MIYPNTPELRAQLHGFPDLAGLDEFVIDDKDFERLLAEARTQHPHEKTKQIIERVIYRCLTLDEKKAEKQQIPSDSTVPPVSMSSSHSNQILKLQERAFKDFKDAHGNITSGMDEAKHHLAALIENNALIAQSASRWHGEKLETVAGQVKDLSNRLYDVETFIRDARENALLRIEEQRLEQVRAAKFRKTLKWTGIIALIVALIVYTAELSFGQNVNPSTVVAVCGTAPTGYPAAGQRAQDTVDVNGLKCSSATTTPSGTQDVNITKVDGILVGTGVPVTGQGTAGTSYGSQVMTIQGVNGGIAAAVSTVGIQQIAGTVTVTDGAGALNVILDSGTLTSITNAVTVSQSTAANLKAQVIGTGTAGSSDANPVTVQGISGGTQLPITANGTAGTNYTSNALTVQGSTTGLPLPVSEPQAMAGTSTASALTVQGNASGIALPVQIMGMTTISGNITSSVNQNVSVSLIAGVGSNYFYLSSCSFNNTSATATLVYLLDGNNGNTLWPLMVPATSGGNNVSWPAPGMLKIPTVGNGLFFKPATTGAGITGGCAGVRSTTSF